MLVITRGYSLGEWSIPTVNLETCGCWTFGKLPRWPRSVVWTERVGPESPSGYVKHSYWTWPFIVDFTMKNGGSFHSYVSLPDIIHNVYAPTHTHTIFIITIANYYLPVNQCASRLMGHDWRGKPNYHLSNQTVQGSGKKIIQSGTVYDSHGWLIRYIMNIWVSTYLINLMVWLLLISKLVNFQ